MKAVSFLLIVLASIGGWAQESAEYRACSGKANTQMEMNACASDEAKRAHDELNRAYASLLAAVKDDALGRSKIRAAEKAWIAYRDAYVEAMYPAKDKAAAYGSIFPLELNLLTAKLAREQIAALGELLKQHRGKDSGAQP